MNRKLITAAVLAAMMGITGVASAQDRHRDDRRGGPDFSRHDERRNDRNDYRNNDRHDDRRDHNRGAGPRHDLHKGGRLPPEYRSRQYVVSDWRSHRLSAPPRGYHWVQTGSDYVLVAITTGVIAGLLLAN
nr:RcnB family protein [uncultured Duganella sp.]